MVVKNGKHRLVGFVDLGEGHDLMSRLSGTVQYNERKSSRESSKFDSYKCYVHWLSNQIFWNDWTAKLGFYSNKPLKLWLLIFRQNRPSVGHSCASIYLLEWQWISFSDCPVSFCWMHPQRPIFHLLERCQENVGVWICVSWNGMFWLN